MKQTKQKLIPFCRIPLKSEFEINGKTYVKFSHRQGMDASGGCITVKDSDSVKAK